MTDRQYIDPVLWPDTTSDDVDDVLTALIDEAQGIYGAVMRQGHAAPIQGALVVGLMLADMTTPAWRARLLAAMPSINIAVADGAAARIRMGSTAARAAMAAAIDQHGGPDALSRAQQRAARAALGDDRAN
jgi:hypothetical protein